MLKVLSVEDHGLIIGLRAEQLRKYPDVCLIEVTSLDGARYAIKENPDIRLVFLDGDVEGGEGVGSPNTIALIPELQTLPEAIIIACAATDDSNEKLLAAGAHETCAKVNVAKRVEKLLWQE